MCDFTFLQLYTDSRYPHIKGRLRNGITNRVPASCCFSGIHAVLGLKFRINYIHVNSENDRTNAVRRTGTIHPKEIAT